ncbi:MAG: hypothetical protein AAF919_03900 [Pseudomonadota bacterium]
MSDRPHIKALEQVVSMARRQTIIFAVPAGILLAQLRSIYLIDSIWLSVLATVSILCLSIGLLAAVNYEFAVEGGLVKEYLFEKGRPEKGLMLYKVFEDDVIKYSKLGDEINEQFLVGSYRQARPLVWFGLYGGYCSLALMILILIWSQPSATALTVGGADGTTQQSQVMGPRE